MSDAILAKIARLEDELCPIPPVPPLLRVLFNSLSGQVDRLDCIFDDFWPNIAIT